MKSLLLYFLLTAPILAQEMRPEAVASAKKLVEEIKVPIHLSYDHATGTARFVRLDSETGSLATATGAAKNELISGFLSNYGALLGVADMKTELKLVLMEPDFLGFTHHIYQQQYKGLKVYAAGLRFHVRNRTELKSVNGVMVPDLNLDVTPKITPDRAAILAVTHMNGRYAADNVENLQPATPELLVYRLGLDRGEPGPNHLAWLVQVGDGHSVKDLVFVDAHRGTVIDRLPAIHTNLQRQVFDNTDNLYTSVWYEGQDLPSSGPDAEVINRLLQVTGETYNFFASISAGSFLSYDANSGVMRTMIHPEDAATCPNAFWNGWATVYCEGYEVDDVIAHEWTHAYTDFTDGLIYRWESGALNESYSDIFGESIDQLNQTGQDTPGESRTGDFGSAYTPPRLTLSVNSPTSVVGVYPAEGANFGPRIGTDSLTGDLVLATDGSTSPTYACYPLTNRDEVLGKIALVDFGGCDSAYKVRNLQFAGAIGVVVINYDDEAPFPLFGEDASVTIPTMIVGRADGEAIRAAVAAGTVNVTLTTDKTLRENSYRWLLGEDLEDGAIRDMWSPGQLAQPGKVSDAYLWCGSVYFDGGGVHINSGVNNRCFSLLVDGGTYNGQDIRGIGLTKAVHIFWRAMSAYLIPISGFYDNAEALEQSALDLIGVPLPDPSLTSAQGLPGEEIITSDDVAQLKKALIAVEMRDISPRCTGANLDAYPITTCPTSPGDVIFEEDFEGNLDSWTLRNEGVFENYEAADWEITNQLPFNRSGKAFYAANLGVYCEVARSSLRRLISPPITITEEGRVRLSFTHYFSSAGGDDGGNVKISVNDGPFELIPAAAFTYNGYTGSLSRQEYDLLSGSNPLVGQAAFFGTNRTNFQGTWGTSVADLSAMVTVGDTITLSFEWGEDLCYGIDGWYLDDIQVAMCGPIVHEPSDRWISQISSEQDDFSTTFYLVNQSEASAIVVLQPYWPDGSTVIETRLEMRPGSRLEFSADELFDGMALGHCSILAPDEVIVSVGYKTKDSPSVTQLAEESRTTGRSFSVRIGSTGLSDGRIALVNLGTEPATVNMTASGGVSVQLASALAPNNRLIYSLSDLSLPPNAQITVTSTQKSAAMILGGNGIFVIQLVPTVGD